MQKTIRQLKDGTQRLIVNLDRQEMVRLRVSREPLKIAINEAVPGLAHKIEVCVCAAETPLQYLACLED